MYAQKYKKIQFRVNDTLFSDLKRKSDGKINRYCKQIIVIQNQVVNIGVNILVSKEILQLFFRTMSDDVAQQYIEIEHLVIQKYSTEYIKTVVGGNQNECLESLFSYLETTYKNEITIVSTKIENSYTWQHNMGVVFTRVYCEVLKKFLHDDLNTNAEVFGNEKEIIIVLKN